MPLHQGKDAEHETRDPDHDTQNRDEPGQECDDAYHERGDSETLGARRSGCELLRRLGLKGLLLADWRLIDGLLRLAACMC